MKEFPFWKACFETIWLHSNKLSCKLSCYDAKYSLCKRVWSEHWQYGRGIDVRNYVRNFPYIFLTQFLTLKISNMKASDLITIVSRGPQGVEVKSLGCHTNTGALWPYLRHQFWPLGRKIDGFGSPKILNSKFWKHFVSGIISHHVRDCLQVFGTVPLLVWAVELARISRNSRFRSLYET